MTNHHVFLEKCILAGDKDADSGALCFYCVLDATARVHSLGSLQREERKGLSYFQFIRSTVHKQLGHERVIDDVIPGAS